MKKIYKPNLQQVFLIAFSILLLLYFNASRANADSSVKEIKFTQMSETEVTVQIRSDDGKPVLLNLYSETGNLEKSIEVLHSKITSIKGLRKGAYKYQCLYKQTPVRSGTLIIK